jgi:2-dehydro-3-deoxygluconokinase
VELVSRVRAPRVACIGECMIEVSDLGGGAARLGYGGDTLNAALYLARLGVAVDYHTALGDDPYSARMLGAWQAEGIGTADVECVRDALPGLYLVETDARGERSFRFWREQSAARRLAELPGWPQRALRLAACEWLYFSAITLSILGPMGRERLWEAVTAARAHGAKVVFDSNYRPRGWPDARSAREAVVRTLPLVDLALPTFEDESALFGDDDPLHTLERLARAGVPRAVVKCGPQPCFVRDHGRVERVPAQAVGRVVDTTAAGDSFNAGLLAALLGGATLTDSAHAGHRLAAAVIQHRGAIIPREAMPQVAAGVA